MESDKNSALFGMIEDKYGTNLSTFEVKNRRPRERSSRSGLFLLNQQNTKPKSLLSKFKKMVKFRDQKASSSTPSLVEGDFASTRNFRSRQGTEEAEDESRNKGSPNVGWWEPSQESLPVEFCRDTSLHGLKFIGQPERHLSERIFWFLVFVAGLSVAVWLISEMWNKYKMNPIIVSFQPYETNVDQVPFPAVTVCNMNKVMRRKAEEIIERASTGEIEAKKDLYYLDHVCSSTKSFAKRFNYTQSGELSDWQRESFMFSETADTENLTRVNTFLRKAAQNCTEMIPFCSWQDQELNCSTLFRPIETEFGKCCTFNMVPLSLLFTRRNDSRESAREIEQWQKWDIEADGLLIQATAEQQEFPRRQMKAGLTNGLSFLLNANQDEYYCTSSDSVGFRMATHLSVELPKIADFGISLRPKSEIFVDVVPHITMVDHDIYRFTLDKRNCYKTGEYNLKHFKYYSVNNCIDECLANYTKNECGCKRYYMPRTVDERLCGPQKFECAEEVRNTKIRGGIRFTCGKCFQSCSEVYYEAQSSSTPLKKDIWKLANGSTSSWNEEDLSIVHVFIGQDSFYAKVPNTGGLMGLCLGFSGLSIIELIYFLTMRAWWKHRRKQVVVTELEEEEVPKWVTSMNNKAPAKSLTNNTIEARKNWQNERTIYTPSYKSIFGEVNGFQR